MRFWLARLSLLTGLTLLVLMVGQTLYLQFLPTAILRWALWRHPYDRLIHATVYGITAALLWLAAVETEPPGSRWRRWSMFTVPLGMSCVGVLDEFAQHWQRPLRFPDPYDALADCAGILLFTLGMWLLHRRWSARRDRWAADPFASPLTVRGGTALFARICYPWFQQRLELTPAVDPPLAARLTAMAPPELAQVFAFSRQAGLGLEAVGRWWPKGSLQHDHLQALCRQDAWALQSTDLRQERAFAELLQALAAENIAVAPFKGPFLAEQVGLSPGLRPASDRDLWIEPVHLDRAIHTLERLGCRQTTADPAVLDYMRNVAHDYHLLHPAIGMIELHTRAYADMRADSFNTIWQRMRPGRYLDAPVRVFNPHDLYVLLCVHLFIHGWTMGLKWVIDLLPFHAVLAAAAPARGVPAPPAAHFLSDLTAAGVAQAAQATDTAFAVLAVQALVGHLTSQPLPPAAGAELRATLTAREQWALAWLEGPGGLSMSTDWMVYQARRSARRRPGVPGSAGADQPPQPTSLWAHPGRIALELQLPSSTPGFWRHRLRWTFKRTGRALLAILGAPSPARLAPDCRLAPLVIPPPMGADRVLEKPARSAL